MGGIAYSANNPAVGTVYEIESPSVGASWVNGRMRSPVPEFCLEGQLVVLFSGSPGTETHQWTDEPCRTLSSVIFLPFFSLSAVLLGPL